MKRVKESAVNNLVFVSDAHCGSKMGLCPPHPIQLPEANGGCYLPSPAQLMIWKRWRYFWDVFVPEATRGEDYGVVFNGDMLDGDHHECSDIISRHLGVQAEIAKECLAPVVRAAGGRAWYVGGTEAHSGKSWAEEHRLARELGVLPDEHGNQVRAELWIMCGPWLGNVAHHIGVTSSAAYETSAVTRELNDIYGEAARQGARPPDFVVRSHRHRRCEVRIPRTGQDAICFVTPGWQLKTPFSVRTAGGRVQAPQIGGVVVRHHEGQLFTRPETWYVNRPRTEVPR